MQQARRHNTDARGCAAGAGRRATALERARPAGGRPVGRQARRAAGPRGAGAGAAGRAAERRGRAGWARPGRAGWPKAVHSVHSACFRPGVTQYLS